jgi:hypothetical protein
MSLAFGETRAAIFLPRMRGRGTVLAVEGAFTRTSPLSLAAVRRSSFPACGGANMALALTKEERQ